AGVIDNGSPAAGTLFVQPRVDGKLLDDVLHHRFLIATRDEDAQNWLSSASLEVWRRIGGERAVIAGSQQVSASCDARPAPSPLVGEGWGGGSRDWAQLPPIARPPPPTPPHQGGG